MFKKFERILVVVGAVVGILSLVLAYEQLRHDQGGDLEELFNSKPVGGNTGSRSIVVCLDDAGTNISDLQFAPAFNNISKYPVRDFSLQHSVNANGVDICANGFYNKIHYNGNTDVYSYIQDKLPSFSMTPYPFENISILKNDAACSITTRASFDGADAPYEYETKLYFMVIPRTCGDFEVWKHKCNERLSRSQLPPETDVYYRASDGFAYSILVNIDKTPEPIAAVSTSSGTNTTEKTRKKHATSISATLSKPESIPAADDKPKAAADVASGSAVEAHPAEGPIVIESYSYNPEDSVFSFTIKPLNEDVMAVVRVISSDGQRQYACFPWFNKYVTEYCFKVYWNQFAENKDNSSQTEVSRADIIYPDSIQEKIKMTTETGNDGQVYTKISSDKNLIAIFGNSRVIGVPQRSYVTVDGDLSKKYNSLITFTLPELDNDNGKNRGVIERFGGWLDFLVALFCLIVFPLGFIGNLYVFITGRKDRRLFWSNLGWTVLLLAISIVSVLGFWYRLNG